MKHSILTLFLLVTIVMISSCSLAPTPRDKEATILQLENLEREWVAAIVAKDTATIDRLLDDEFIGTTNETRYSKAIALEDIVTGKHETLALDEIDVRLFGSLAVVTMAQDEKSRHGEDDFTGRYYFTNVWMKKGGEWKAIASHGSRTTSPIATAQND